MLELIFLVVGVMIGMNIKNEIMHQKYVKTVEQVDAEIRRDLEYYRNLSESLKQDLSWAKHKNDLHNK